MAVYRTHNHSEACGSGASSLKLLCQKLRCVRMCVWDTHCIGIILRRVPDVAEQQQPAQVAVAHHLGADPGRPGHDAHAAGWAPLASAATLVNLPAWACMSTPLTSAEQEHGCRLKHGQFESHVPVQCESITG